MKTPLTYIIRFSFLLSGIFLLLFFFSYVFSQNIGDARPKNDLGISLVIDVSQSMQVQDVDNIGRLEAVKKDLEKRFIEEWNPVWITIFAGEAQRVLPFTTQKDLVLTVLSSVDSKNLQKQGTDVVSAVAAWLRQFLPEQTGKMILFSDGGEESIGDISAIEKKVQEQNIEVVIVWVGSKNGGNILLWWDAFGSPVYKFYRWERVVSKLEDASLQELAIKLWWKYMTFKEFQRYSLLSDSSIVQKSTDIFFYLAFIFWFVVITLFIVQKETWKY